LKAKDIIPNGSPEPELTQPHDERRTKAKGSSKKRKRESSPAPATGSSQKYARAYDPSEVIDIDDLESDNDSDFVILNDPVEPKVRLLYTVYCYGL
jgi:hypothetical protein